MTDTSIWTATDFGAAIDAYVATRDVETAMTTLNLIRDHLPEGVTVRISHRGTSINIGVEGESVALFHLNKYRSRSRDEKLTAFAWASIQGVGRSVHQGGAMSAGHQMDRRELATVLAALRTFQRLGSEETIEENDIANDGGAFDALTIDEISALCERLNVA